ncbi:AI-2E family transporter [Nitrospirillum viridazoti]|uniref:AI-2E family transporter n=1 Tax=Nitrospirillum viridazoti CBAmc TaxID=1441467 RepID=A0A248JV63_9PROT|nr:AI-2E family transporter [Nitrospirillum amazonense]ASG22602.1 AI-2E family transporter [Nitrospirillum amazonense CBAmc]TWB42830.1 putative PurR-regulated permease PerM [Nitrospirillum amazonense]
MAETHAGRQIRFWLVGLVVGVVLIWLLRGMLLPFVAGMAIAYLLDPVADRLEGFGLPRLAATCVVLLIFVVVVVLCILLLVPLIQQQVTQLIESLPAIITWARDETMQRVRSLMAALPPDDIERLRGAASEYVGTLVGWGADFIKNLFSGGAALFGLVSLLFITPVVAFYLLRDWDRMVATLDGWLPREHAEVVREQLRAVDRTLAGFVRGQATVCLALGAFYALAMTAVGLNFGLVIGLIAGILSFIPYVGTVVGFGASVGVALFQFHDLWREGLVVALYILGHLLEGYVLTPKLVGDKVGLHPVWVMFALLAGGSLFGFTGVLLAVPVAAVIGVLVRFGLRQYLASSYYTGVPPEEVLREDLVQEGLVTPGTDAGAPPPVP